MTWATFVPILVFLGLYVLDLGPMYATDRETDVSQTDVNSFAADFLAPSAGKNIYVREIKLQSLTFVNRAITVTNGTEGVLSTLVANGTGTVSTIVAIGSERVNHKVVTRPASSLAQARESSPAETSVLTTMLCHHCQLLG